MSFISCLRQAPHIPLNLAGPWSAGKDCYSHDLLLNCNHSLLLQSRTLIKSIHSAARSEMRLWKEQRNQRIPIIHSSITCPERLFHFSLPLSDYMPGPHSPVMCLSSQRFSCCQPLFPEEKLLPREVPIQKSKSSEECTCSGQRESFSVKQLSDDVKRGNQQLSGHNQ